MGQAAISEELPIKVRPYCQVLELKEALVFKILLIISYGVKKTICQDSDIVLALLGLTETEITDQQARRIARQFIADGWFELVGEDNCYEVTADTKRRCQTPEVRARVAQIDASKDKTRTPKASKKQAAADTQSRLRHIKTVAARSTIRVPADSVLLAEGIQGRLSAEKLNKFFPLFMEAGAADFAVNARRRASELGFSSAATFNIALSHLKGAGWLIAVSYGIARWDLDKVPPQWRAALAKKGELPDQVPEDPEGDEEDDDGVEDMDEVEAETAPVSEAEEAEEVGDEPTDDDEAGEEAGPEVAADPGPQPDPIDESEAQRLFGLLLAVTVDGLYRQIEHMPRELQILVLKALNERINE